MIKSGAGDKREITAQGVNVEIKKRCNVLRHFKKRQFSVKANGQRYFGDFFYEGATMSVDEYTKIVHSVSEIRSRS